MAGKKQTQEEVINRFIATHGNLYDYSKVIYVNSEQKVEIICKKEDHGSWWTTPATHYHKHGCPKCRNEQYSINNRLTIDEVLVNFHETHGDKYDYSKIIYINAKTKIEIICPKEGHGSFWQNPADHYQGRGCAECDKEWKRENYKLDKETVFARFYQKHGDKYNYSLVNYIDCDTEVKIICSVLDHLPFWQTPRNHFESCGCLDCSKII